MRQGRASWQAWRDARLGKARQEHPGLANLQLSAHTAPASIPRSWAVAGPWALWLSAQALGRRRMQACWPLTHPTLSSRFTTGTSDLSATPATLDSRNVDAP